MKSLPTIKRQIDPNRSFCVSCNRETPKAFTRTGKIYVRSVSIVKTDVELIYNPVTQQVTESITEKRIPINEWREGFICDTCASDYSTVEHTRKDGSTWYEPVVKLDPSPTQHTTLNPGTGTDLDREPFDSGFGFQRNLEQPELDRACYSYFRRGR